jgi:hypothetical protein
VVPLAPNAKVTFNGRAVPLAQAFWDGAERTVYRFDIVNARLGDSATEAVVLNADGSKTMYMVRLKVLDGRSPRSRRSRPTRARPTGCGIPIGSPRCHRRCS